VIDSNKLARDAQISSRNLRKLDCAGKPVPTFPHPALMIFMTREIGKSSRSKLGFFEKPLEIVASRRGPIAEGARLIDASSRGQKHCIPTTHFVATSRI
jgi:hypothetical protein